STSTSGSAVPSLVSISCWSALTISSVIKLIKKAGERPLPFRTSAGPCPTQKAVKIRVAPHKGACTASRGRVQGPLEPAARGHKVLRARGFFPGPVAVEAIVTPPRLQG